MARRASAISDYALIGDCRSAALVSRVGSIDWLCWPRFDSPSIFAAVLDTENGGSWSISPGASASSTRRYVGNTAVLETTFETATGTVVVVDAMPVVSPEDEKAFLSPEHELVRRVTCTRGEVELLVVFDPKPDYAERPLKWRDAGRLGLRVETGQGLLVLRSDVAMRVTDGEAARARVVVRAGDELQFSLSFAVDTPAVISPLGATTRAAIDRSIALWNAWSARTTYSGPYAAQVMRSAITIKLLGYAPSGAIVAAPTTSLPESMGGSHNWDYRYCWLRDAAFTVRGLLALGHAEEAGTFVQWLLHATRLTQPELLVLYDVYGRSPPRERVVERLRGHQGSRPVRVGNAADRQLQLDSYGEVVDAVWRIARAGTKLDHETARVILAFGAYVCRHWLEPDEGIWEPRTGRRRHTHSLVLCWTALDRLLDLQRTGDLPRRHAGVFEAEREAIWRVVEHEGFSERLGSYTSELGGTSVDATSLLFGWYGFTTPSSVRMKSTFERVRRELSPEPGLLYRYPEDKGEEGAFGIASFWMAEHLARGGGTYEEARSTFEATLAFANDVGLFGEEIEPRSGRALGNFPQTFTHVGLVNAALSLAERRAERRDAA